MGKRITAKVVERCLAHLKKEHGDCPVYMEAQRHWKVCNGRVVEMLMHPSAWLWCHWAGMHVPGLGPVRWSILLRMRSAYSRYLAARNVSTLTSAHRWTLLRGIQDENLRYYAARDIKRLSTAKRWLLVRHIRDPHERMLAARDVPGLSRAQRDKLREGLSRDRL